jgi:hypothetical protein
VAWTCDLFVRTYWRDLDWLALCLESIVAYCQGFRSVVVVLPQSSSAWLRRADLPGNGRFLTTSDFRDDYLGQQVTKLTSDTFTDADFICHVDADCIFSRLTTPAALIHGDRPLVSMLPSSQLGRHSPWRKVTEDFLGWSVAYDFMQSPPFTYPRWLYQEVRAHARRVHGVDIETYVTSQPPRGFSEFNVLGAFAWERHRECFVWRDTSVHATADPPCRWYWSWGGLDISVRREIEGILHASQ